VCVVFDSRDAGYAGRLHSALDAEDVRSLSAVGAAVILPMAATRALLLHGPRLMGWRARQSVASKAVVSTGRKQCRMPQPCELPPNSKSRCFLWVRPLAASRPSACRLRYIRGSSRRVGDEDQETLVGRLHPSSASQPGACRPGYSLRVQEAAPLRELQGGRERQVADA